jgi:hypothetical protein
MAEKHDDHNPNAAPMHTDARESFGAGAVALCYILTLVALVAGLAAGLLLVNN